MLTLNLLVLKKLKFLFLSLLIIDFEIFIFEHFLQVFYFFNEAFPWLTTCENRYYHIRPFSPFSSITFFLISSSPRVYKAFAVLDLILWVRPLTEEGGSVAKVFWMI